MPSEASSCERGDAQITDPKLRTFCLDYVLAHSMVSEMQITWFVCHFLL